MKCRGCGIELNKKDHDTGLCTAWFTLSRLGMSERLKRRSCWGRFAVWALGRDFWKNTKPGVDWTPVAIDQWLAEVYQPNSEFKNGLT